MADHDEGALARWSRRKRESDASATGGAARQDTTTDGAATELPIQADCSAECPSDVADPLVSVEDLPDVETLTYQSDFTPFLQSGVPDALRRMALARLWRSDPILANLDGLNDYDDDYRIVAETNGPLMKLIEPESRAELSLEREKRLAHRERGPQHEPRRPEQKPKDIEAASNAQGANDDTGKAGTVDPADPDRNQEEA